MGRLNSGVSATSLDDDGRTEVEREPVDRCAEHRADDQRHPAAQCDRRAAAAMMRCATAEHDARGHQRRTPLRRRSASAGTPDGTAATPKSNSIWNTDRPMSRPPKRQVLDELQPMPSCGGVARRPSPAVPSYSRISTAISGQSGAADHHQMRWTPKRYVLAEDAVPDVVHGEADERIHAAYRHQHAAEGGRTRCG